MTRKSIGQIPCSDSNSELGLDASYFNHLTTAGYVKGLAHRQCKAAHGTHPSSC